MMNDYRKKRSGMLSGLVIMIHYNHHQHSPHLTLTTQINFHCVTLPVVQIEPFSITICLDHEEASGREETADRRKATRICHPANTT